MNKKHARREKKLICLIKQVKLQPFQMSPKYQYGFQVQKNYGEACRFDERNRNNKWIFATTLEMKQLDEYDIFIDRGEFQTSKIPEGFKKIKVQLIFVIKHDGRHKARMVADGHLTDVPFDSVYSGAVSLGGLRMSISLAELNGMETHATDIGNAYLEAKTEEKVCIWAGPEFGPLEVRLHIIYKALYGLSSSGLRFHELFGHYLNELGFKPSLCEPDIFMRQNREGLWEYVATYVDNLCIVMRNPNEFL